MCINQFDYQLKMDPMMFGDNVDNDLQQPWTIRNVHSRKWSIFSYLKYFSTPFCNYI